MPIRPRFALVAAADRGGRGVSGVDGRAPVNDAELQFQLGTLLFDETRYRRGARRVPASPPTPRTTALAIQARIGVVKSALRLGEFAEAQREAATLKKDAPRNPEAMSVHADALWSAGLFDEADQEFRDALALVPDLVARPPRPRQGAGLAEQAGGSAQRGAGGAQALAARRGDPPHGRRHLRAHAPLRSRRPTPTRNYVNLLPNKDRSDKAAWSRSQIRFLQVVREREPIAIDDDSRGRACTPWTSASWTTRSSSRSGSTAAGRRTSCSTPARRDDHLAPDGGDGRRAADHLHAQRRRRRGRPPRPAARRASTASRSAR